MDVRIRPAVAADRGPVERIVTAAYTPWIEVLGVRPLPMEADYGALIGAGRVWVTDPPAGLVVLVPEDGCLLVENVAVDPAFQGRGLGRRLMAFAEERARALGLSRLRLYTNALMARNIALYERLGYRETGRETFPTGHRAVHMDKSLTW
ncbi:GNAT family N-acetyltransferase [Actinomadura kijaniata]|uniref:Ribosomal protein S18 acetylase RimI-like enzyme n=1 Tax=Actinomadura namibiensis TaxID=182080 RepID=A0A7W3LUQ5_ACTNM|nr:GNAT family N-acetyltransferase [Actinomadura namibiensis]MBA8954592.1 ribosomal protein S18 acetylase RimI-like enzyme [Actinomadura namibiensis]